MLAVSCDVEKETKNRAKEIDTTFNLLLSLHAAGVFFLYAVVHLFMLLLRETLPCVYVHVHYTLCKSISV